MSYMFYAVIILLCFRLNETEESHAFRYTAAKIFNNFFFIKPISMIRQGVNNSTTSYFTTEDINAFSEVFYSCREFTIKKTTSVSNFHSTDSLEKLWLLLEEKLNAQVFDSDNGQKGCV
jgi:hypothetical protein